MELSWYVVFAIVVATMSIVDLYHPVMQKHEMSFGRRIMFYLVWFIIALLIAPLLVYPCLRSIVGLEFRLHLEDGLFPKD